MNQKIPRTNKVEFLVEDFGPIVRAEFDLRPLTVFVGQSNTGKSCLATLVHTLFAQCARNSVSAQVPRSARGTELESLSDAERSAFVKWLEDYEELDPERSADIPALPEIVDQATRRLFSEMRGYREGIGDLLAKYFWVEDIRALVRAGATGPAQVRVSMPETPAQATIRIDSKTGTVSARGDLPPTLTFTPDRTLDRMLPLRPHGLPPETNGEKWPRLAYQQIVRHAFRRLFRPLTHASHYFPADRTGIMGLHEGLVWASIDRATYARRDLPSDVPPLSGVHGDLLKEIVMPQRAAGMHSEIAAALEDDILGGAILEERTGEAELPTFFYQPRGGKNGWRIPLRNASSAVSELAPVVLLLRRRGGPGDLLIIEEPEIHLHPGAQAKLAVQLTRLANSGIRVLVTTHSQWILEQFANLVGLSTLEGRAKTRFEERHPYLAGVGIPSEKVGVWLFSPEGGSGSTVSEIKLDTESGVFPAQFDDVSVSIYSDWAEIYNEFQEAQGDGHV